MLCAMANKNADGSDYKTVGAAAASILILVFVVVWSVIVASKIGHAPKLQTKTEGPYDSFEQAKSILVLLLPLLTTAAGYWLGSLGTAKAEKEASNVKERNEALLTAGNPQILQAAINVNPAAFGK